LIQFLAYAPCFVAEIRLRQPTNPILEILDVYHRGCRDANQQYVDIGACLRKMIYGNAHNNTQEDAASALMILLSRIDQPPPIKVCITVEYKIHPQLTRMLTPGVNYNNYSALDEKNRRTRCDPVWMIDVTAVEPLVNLSMSKVIDSIFSWRLEDSTEQNYYKCLSSDKRSLLQCQPLRSRLTFQCDNTPSFLVFTLQRMVDHPVPQKVQGPIRMPNKFQLTISDSVYELEAVIVHIGATLHSGHYIAYCKSNGNWWCCNDASVCSLNTAELPERARNYGYVYYYKECHGHYGIPSIRPRTICTPLADSVAPPSSMVSSSYFENSNIPAPPIIKTNLGSQELSIKKETNYTSVECALTGKQNTPIPYKHLLLAKAQRKRQNAHFRACTTAGIDSSQRSKYCEQTLAGGKVIQQQQQLMINEKSDHDDPLGQFLNIAALITGAIAVAGSIVFGATALKSHIESLELEQQRQRRALPASKQPAIASPKSAAM
jgi:hypothetical protein